LGVFEICRRRVFTGKIVLLEATLLGRKIVEFLGSFKPFFDNYQVKRAGRDNYAWNWQNTFPLCTTAIINSQLIQ
jgi:hypothetical protein